MKGGCVLWSIDWLVFVTRADCRRWVRLLILPLWLKVWNHSLVSFFGQKSNLTCPPPTPLWIWLSDIRHLSELHIAVFFCYTPEQKQADPGFWPAGVRRSVFESFPEMQWHTSASVRPRVPLLLHSAYWAASPGVRTESLTNIKALCWCGFVQCLELQGLTLHSFHTKSKETCAGVCVWRCVYVFVVNKLRTLVIQWEHSIEHPEMVATFNSTLFETWVGLEV